MGNIRFGFIKAILSITLLFSVAPDFAFSKGSCQSFFARQESRSATRSYGTKLLDKTRLKIANWNLLEFKIDINALERGLIPSSRTSIANNRQVYFKTIEELNAYKKILVHLNADIYVFQEAIVGSLKYFAKHYLKDEYEVVIGKNKKDTEFQIVFLVRKSLDVQVELQSYEHLKWRNTMVSPPRDMPVFRSDLPALYLRQNDGTTGRPSDAPNLVIFGTHFKSKRDSPGDPQSFKLRSLQMHTAARVIHSVNQRYRYQVPIMLTGDFNTNLKNAAELEPLKLVLKDSLILAGKNQSLEATYTHEHHSRNNEVFKDRLDGQLINDALKVKLSESFVEHFSFNKSDHSPVVSYYDMTR